MPRSNSSEIHDREYDTHESSTQYDLAPPEDLTLSEEVDVDKKEEHEIEISDDKKYSCMDPL
jgi:hypothetical protein